MAGGPAGFRGRVAGGPARFRGRMAGRPAGFSRRMPGRPAGFGGAMPDGATGFGDRMAGLGGGVGGRLADRLGGRRLHGRGRKEQGAQGERNAQANSWSLQVVMGCRLSCFGKRGCRDCEPAGAATGAK